MHRILQQKLILIALSKEIKYFHHKTRTKIIKTIIKLTFKEWNIKINQVVDNLTDRKIKMYSSEKIPKVREELWQNMKL